MKNTMRNRQQKNLTAQELLSQANTRLKETIIQRAIDYSVLDAKYLAVKCPATKLWLPVQEFYDDPYSYNSASNLNPNGIRRTSRFAWNQVCYNYKTCEFVRACGVKLYDDQILSVVNEEQPDPIPANLGGYLV